MQLQLVSEDAGGRWGVSKTSSYTAPMKSCRRTSNDLSQNLAHVDG